MVEVKNLRKEPKSAATKLRKEPTSGPRTAGRAVLDDIFGYVSMPLAFAGMRKKEFALDAAALQMHKDPICDAILELADKYPEVAAVLNNLAKVSPFGALIGAIVPLSLQIATNHEIIPPPMAEQLGAVPKQALQQHLNSEAQKITEDRNNGEVS